MKLHFDFVRTMQAAGVLLECEDSRQMSYIRLLKLLYIADRELLAETGDPLTGDHALAMKYGPVLSHTYSLIKGESSRGGEWDAFIHTDGYKVKLRTEPGRGELTKREMAKLRTVSERFRDVQDFDLCELTHGFEEWKKHYSESAGAVPIPWEDALLAQGKPEMIAIAVENEQTRRDISHFLERAV